MFRSWEIGLKGIHLQFKTCQIQILLKGMLFSEQKNWQKSCSTLCLASFECHRNCARLDSISGVYHVSGHYLIYAAVYVALRLL
jgi:hypothetical protein